MPGMTFARIAKHGHVVWVLAIHAGMTVFS